MDNGAAEVDTASRFILLRFDAYDTSTGIAGLDANLS